MSMTLGDIFPPQSLVPGHKKSHILEQRKCFPIPLIRTVLLLQLVFDVSVRPPWDSTLLVGSFFLFAILKIYMVAYYFENENKLY